MILREAKDADRPRWDEFVLRHPNGLAYQLFAWKKAVEEAYGFPGTYLLAEEGGIVRGVLPLILMKSPFGGKGRYVSLPYCDAGGVLADDPSTAEELVRFAETTARERSAAGLELRHATPPEGVSPGCAAHAGKVRMLLELPPDSERLLAGLKAKLRSQVKKPSRDGLSFRHGGPELVDDFYAIFSVNMRDLGSPVHSRKWIRAVAAHFGERARIGVVCTPDRIPAAAGIILMHSRTVSVPWASSLRRFNHLNPNMLLYWSFLAFAADGKYARFDFGRSTPEEGTYRFKEQWGAVPVPLFWEERMGRGSTAGRGFLAGAGRRSAETIWAALPVSATRILGPVLRRHISL